jgi:tetratricopeptide (TPR) repeat protein
VVALACAVLASALAGEARAADCSVSDYPVAATSRVAALLEAGGLAANGKWTDARAGYLWVLARYPDDPEALAGLARVDAWGGCWALAEKEFATVIATHPEDADVRAGYADLLMWRGRTDDAERVLAAGLALDASAPSLLARQARFASWRGDAADAVRLGDQAERGAPDDDEIRSMRDHLFMGEGRATAHIDYYSPPSKYQSVLSFALQGLQRVGRFELSAGAQLVDRVTWANGPSGAQQTNDVRYPIDVSYHPAMGWLVGVELAPASPSAAVPVIAARGFLIAPLFGPFDASLSYDFWHFDNKTDVHLFNPGVGISLPHELRLDLRAWIAVVTSPPGANGDRRTEPAGAGGAQITWSATSRLDLALSAAYGRELDATVIQESMLSYVGPSVQAVADWLVQRHFGFRGAAGLQWMTQPSGASFTITSFELGGYGRW